MFKKFFIGFAFCLSFLMLVESATMLESHPDEYGVRTPLSGLSGAYTPGSSSSRTFWGCKYTDCGEFGFVAKPLKKKMKKKGGTGLAEKPAEVAESDSGSSASSDGGESPTS